MLKNHLKSFVAGALAMLLITATVTLVASGTGLLREIHHGISVVLNGQPAEFPEDSQPFVMNDRTYLPLRAMADLLDLPVDFDPDTNTAYVGYACITELMLGVWSEVDIWGMWQMIIEFRADGTAVAYEVDRHGDPDERHFVEYFAWHLDSDGNIVLGPVDADLGVIEIQVAVFRDLFSNGEIMRLTVIYSGEVDEVILLERVR